MFVYVCIYVYIYKVQINIETLQNKQKIQYDNLLSHFHHIYYLSCHVNRGKEIPSTKI